MKEALDRDEHRKADEPVAAGVLAWLGARSDRFSGHAALCAKQGKDWRELSYGDLSHQSRRLAAYLMEFGVQQGDRIVILSESRPEWGICFFAGILAGAIVVPLDIKLSQAELTSILTHCAPRVMFISPHCREIVSSLRTHVPSIQLVAFLEGDRTDNALPSVDQLSPRELLPSRERHFDEVAVITYTSGTTGSPKGVMTTFGNLAFQVKAFEQLLGIGPKDRFLSILPLNHLLELTGGFLAVLNSGGMVCYSQSLYPHDIARFMRERCVTTMIGVPIFFTALKRGIEGEYSHMNPVGRFWYRAAMRLSRMIPWRTWRRGLFFPLHRRFGGRVRAFVCGGAPLDEDVAQFFDCLGLPILQGYGLTETSPVISVNTLSAHRIGSVGRPLKGLEVKIGLPAPGQSEGEILTRGPHVMQGYYKRPDLTAEVIDEDGWLHTGDLGRIDADGFLHITGRIKNLIVLGGGKKVYPEEVEAVLARGATVKEVCVLGRRSRDGISQGTEEVCVIAVPSDTLIRRWHDKTGSMEQEIRREFEQLAKDLAPYKRPSRVVVHHDELPKTAVGKIKRRLVAQWLDRQAA